MNQNKIDWIQKSLDFVYGDGYLEKLTDIYPINENISRYVDENLIKEIKVYFKKKDPMGLVKSCLKLKKFPIDNSYTSILRNEKIFEKNSEVVKKIGNILLGIGVNDLKTLMKSPKSGSRQFGNSFKFWLKKKYKNDFLPLINFKNYKGNDLKFLDGSDMILKEYIRSNFKIDTEKGLDLVFRKGDKTFFGEAKFITDSGGTQTNQLNIALDIAKKDSDEIGSIAIIDGVPWINSSYLNKIREVPNKNVLTALLLPEYLSNL